MEFLWHKENAADDALYRDLFANIAKDFRELMSYDLSSMSADFVENTMRKVNAFSDHRRKEGNEKFKEGKWNDALTAYNECLCLAEINTENVALGYGNRSACYFELKMYGKCLIDIELALNEKWPERLKAKLEKRRADCMKLLPLDSIPQKFEVKLSYEADENFPFMANILEIRKNDKFGRYVIAKCDIPAGQTVVFEDNFVSFTKTSSYVNKTVGPMKCATCNKVAANPIPCLKCPIVMFCGTECRIRNKVHQMDCGAVYHWVGSNDKYIVQSVLVVVNMFPTIEDLMNFVVEAVKGDKYEIPKSIVDQRSRYRMFLKLWRPSKMADFIAVTYKLYSTIIRLDGVKKLFDSLMKRRFLMHLMGHHALILLNNAMEGQIGVFTALLSHSCAPNVQEMWIDNRTACMTIRPIQKGEQLYVCYMPEEVCRLDVKTELYAKFGFRCNCIKCEGKLADLKRIEMDTSFRDLKNTRIDNSDKVMLQDFIAKSVALLNKNGRLPWSCQLEHISKRLAYCMGVFYYSVEVK